VYGSDIGTLDRVRIDLDECECRLRTIAYHYRPIPNDLLGPNSDNELSSAHTHKQGQTDPTDNLSDPSYPTPAYPPPVSQQQPQGNPYAAQQTYTAVPGMGSNSNSNPAPQVQQGGYSAAGAYQQYGQQDGYDTVGGREPVQQVGMNGAGGSDFWAEVS
jgi:hypothetical protein